MKIKILFLIMLLPLVACQPNGRGSQGGSGNNYELPAPKNDGGIDSGGGNGIKGKNIEDYRVLLEDQLLFQKMVLPLLVKLSERAPMFAGELLFIAREKSWYFVPVPLNSLPSEGLGLPVKNKDLDQNALHKKNEIFIDSVLFDNMADASQYSLLVHELIMGVRFLEYNGPNDNCIAGVTYLSFLKPTEYKIQRDNCFSLQNKAQSEWQKTFEKQTVTIDKSEYPGIRNLTHMLIKRLEMVSPDELSSAIQQTVKRKYKN